MSKRATKPKNKKAKSKDPLDQDMSFVFDDQSKWKRFGDLLELTPEKKDFALKMSAKLLNHYKKLARAKGS